MEAFPRSAGWWPPWCKPAMPSTAAPGRTRRSQRRRTGGPTCWPIRARECRSGVAARWAVERTFYRLADAPREVILVACSKCEWKAAFRRDDLGRVLINSDCSASPPKRRNMLSLSEAQAIFFLRRHQPRRPPLAKIRPGRPAPTMGPGTWAKKPRISPLPKVEL